MNPNPDRWFIVGDTHGNREALLGLLMQEGITDRRGQRINHDVTTIHVGDLANCVAESEQGDVACLKLGRRVFDKLLVGNHEMPYFGGMKFGGFFEHASVRDEIKKNERAGLIVPSTVVGPEGEILITHAGVTPTADAGWSDAVEANDEIWEAWHDRGTSHADFLFNGCGRARGGMSLHGGILWADYTETKVLTFSQIFGHTPGDEVRISRENGTFAACIDLGCGKRIRTNRGIRGARQGGVWVEASGNIVPVVYG